MKLQFLNGTDVCNKNFMDLSNYLSTKIAVLFIANVKILQHTCVTFQNDTQVYDKYFSEPYVN